MEQEIETIEANHRIEICYFIFNLWHGDCGQTNSGRIKTTGLLIL